MSENLLAAGIWPCVVLSADFGDNAGSPDVQVNVRITDGPSKGRQCTYQDQVNAKSGLYIGRSLAAIGFPAGASLKDTKKHVAAWIEKTGGASTVEIKHIELKRGKKFDEWVSGGMVGPGPVWDKPNSIGRGPKPLTEAKGELLTDADRALQMAAQADGRGGTPPDDQVPEEDCPFISCSLREPSPLARSVR